MTLNDADRAEIARVCYDGISEQVNREVCYLAGLAAGRLRGIEEAVRECDVIANLRFPGVEVVGAVACARAIRALAASGTGAKE